MTITVYGIANCDTVKKARDGCRISTRSTTSKRRSDAGTGAEWLRNSVSKKL